MSGYRPGVGDPVQVTITGVLSRVDTEAGHVYVLGNAPGQDHIEWEWCLHWATEFTDPTDRADQPCAECGVEEYRHHTVEGCSGFRPLPTPPDGES